MAAEDNMPQKSPFAKLFSSDARADKELQKIRDRIYSFLWSGERRDTAKLDWVLSENGVNRNVFMEWMGQPTFGRSHDPVDGLPCWLLLANKRISEDFTRFIYSVNDLDILVDLKADHTELNEAKLDKIVTLLDNVNFERYTKSARVRIHFPYKYPFQNLPVFNQYALDNIALALDGFQQLTSLSVRIVPMQGPEDYELRFAAFPFYPMSMTDWSIRLLNSRTFNWDMVTGEQHHHLNLAWDLFQETGSLTATVHAPVDAEKPKINVDQTPRAKGADDVPKNLVVGQKKNGSQKRKGRKLKALSTATAPSASEATSKVPSTDMPLQSSSPSSHPSKGPRSIPVSGAGPSDAKLPNTELPIRSAGVPPDTVSPAYNATGNAHQPSSPASSNKLETSTAMKNIPTSEVRDDAVENEHTAEQDPCPASSIETAPEDSMNQQKPQNTSPSSSAPSSVTLGRDQSDDETAIHDTVEEPPHVETTLRGAGADSEKPAQKKRRNRKKSKKTQSTDAAGIQLNDDSGQQNSAETEENTGTFLIDSDSAAAIITMDGHWDGLLLNNHRPFPLSEIVELGPCATDERLLLYKRANGKRGILARSSDLDRLLRQKERIAAQETERQAEKMRAKGKRKTKKVKEVMIRRKEPSDSLRRAFKDTKQPAAVKQGSDLRKRFNEITGGGLEKAVPASQVNSPEDFESSDEDSSSTEDTWSSPEQADSSQRGTPTRPDHLDVSSVSHRRQPSSSSHAAGSILPRSTQLFNFPNDVNTGEEGSQVEHQGRQMDEQHLVEEVEDSDDCGSVVSQYGDEGPPSIFEDEEQNPTAW